MHQSVRSIGVHRCDCSIMPPVLNGDTGIMVFWEVPLVVVPPGLDWLPDCVRSIIRSFCSSQTEQLLGK